MRFSIPVKLSIAFGVVILLTAWNALEGTNALSTVVETYEDGALRLTETARLTEEVAKYTLSAATL